MPSPTMLVILDGFGYRSARDGNAIANAKMPFWSYLCGQYPSALLKASGQEVGLLPGFIGNSEVGHLTLGAGRVIPSVLKRFHDAIANKSIFGNKTLIENFKKLKTSGKALHLIGLLSDAGVHSHEDHLFALLKMAKDQGLDTIFIHAFLDGRDTPPKSASIYLQRLEDLCITLGTGTIASIQGRFYAMDRDHNWDRTQTSYQALCGKITPLAPISWQEALKKSYQNNITDEFVVPTILDPQGFIQSGDGVIFFNFRPDRAQQLTQAFINPDFGHFANKLNTGDSLAFFITTTRYNQNFKNPILFERETVAHTLLDEIAMQKQQAPVYIIAETEKYAHVTYFFRGMEDKQLASETRVLIPSIKTKNYIQHPEMSAPSITQSLIHSLRSKPAFFYLVNYANADMVGHSGNFAATIKACEILDQQLALLYHEVVDRLDGTLIITADHGNAEEKIDPAGNPLTAHTTNPVPFLIASKKKYKKIKTTKAFCQEPILGLAHGAPTILKVMGLSIPKAMEQETIF